VALFLGAGLIAAFLAWERQAAEPMIPLALFRSRSFAAAVATQFLLASAIYSAAFLTSQYFQFALGDSPLGTGLRFMPWTATPMIIAPLAGAGFDQIGARPLIVPGLLMQALGFAWIVYLAARSAGCGLSGSAAGAGPRCYGAVRIVPSGAERAGDRRACPAHSQDRCLRVLAVDLRYPRRATSRAECADGVGDRPTDLRCAGLVGTLQRRCEQRVGPGGADVEVISL
jgi:hypothetical protein